MEKQFSQFYTYNLFTVIAVLQHFGTENNAGQVKVKYTRYVNDVKSCCPSVFIVNFEHHSLLFLAFSIGDFEQVIVCYIIFTPLYSDFVISGSCLSIYTLKAQRHI